MIQVANIQLKKFNIMMSYKIII